MNKEKNKNQFLKEKNSSSSKHHKEYLGMDVPEGYFKTSKSNILEMVGAEVKETPVFYLRRPFQIAASITLLVVLTISIQFSSTNSGDDFEIATDDTLIESLFVDDNNMNDFVEGVLVSEIVEKAEKSEQDLENVFINSLFVDDSLIDGYAKESLIDNIIL
ncbi:hypothetical protein AAON49_10770 [Pseudotenacibaculum sp. MALMAid0570]|uniref:hypothetical protein n=1 Tax=Pseudotenacibaculum sp. MALMAid0570 TaxID=3143938 RepID=UPI0032DEED61